MPTFYVVPAVEPNHLNGEAMAEVVPEVRARIEDLLVFRETGKRILLV